MMSTNVGVRTCRRCGARLANDNREPMCRPCLRAARADESRPPEVPSEFWDTDAFRDALLGERHIGRAVRIYRKHPFHGRRPLPQELMARWLNIGQSQLARIERGRPITDLERLVQWATTLQIPQKYLWFSLPPVNSDEGEEVKRRQFITAAAALPAISREGLALTEQIPHFVPDSDLRDIVNDIAALRIVLARQDNILGASAVAPTVIHQIAIMKRLSARSRGEARHLLMRVQAAYAEFGSWLSDELGDRASGQFWVDRALEWAHETPDGLIVGYILARKAQRAVDDNDPSAAIGLAQAAQRCELTDRVRAAALQYEAIGYASMAATAEFRESIDRAQALTESLSPAREDDWALWCTPEYALIHEANGWVLLGEPSRAVAAYQQALSKWPSNFLRDEGVYYGRLARAHAMAKDPEGAVTAGRKALDIATRTGSARIIAELAPLTGELGECRMSSAAREFESELRGALSEHAEPQA